jgi:hypothetical protein
MPKKTKKNQVEESQSKLIGIRIPKELFEKLENISRIMNTTPSQVVKSAVIDWIEIFFNVRQQGLVIISKKFISDLIETVGVEKINRGVVEHLAEKLADYYQFVLGKPFNQIPLDEFMKIVVKILGNTGLFWFDHVEFLNKDEIICFKGVHDMNESWSKLFVEISNYLMKKYYALEFVESNSNYVSNSIYLEYKKA